jgi:hypothetical protein
MKVTTVRFGTDLWALLEEESSRVGVSVSQYIREAALARASAAAAARGDAPFELLAGAIADIAVDHPDAARRRAAQHALAALARLTAADTKADTHALKGESEQARRMAEHKRQRAARLARQTNKRRRRSSQT